jgi:Adenylate and Guanylate cyclase catalytic domain
VRDRLLQRDPQSEKPLAASTEHAGGFINSQYRARRQSAASIEIPPPKMDVIADLFPQTTVLIADIAGFTSWSSSRGPHQVFTLLQTVYEAFDKIAHKLHVFKVETMQVPWSNGQFPFCCLCLLTSFLCFVYYFS